MPENFKNFIAGEWVAPTTGAYFENRNPADWDDVIGCFPRSGAEDVALAEQAGDDQPQLIRLANDDLLDVLDDTTRNRPGIIHSFTSTKAGVKPVSPAARE